MSQEWGPPGGPHPPIVRDYPRILGEFSQPILEILGRGAPEIFPLYFLVTGRSSRKFSTKSPFSGKFFPLSWAPKRGYFYLHLGRGAPGFEKVQPKAPTVCGGAPEKYTLGLFGFPFSDPSWGFSQILPDWLREGGA